MGDIIEELADETMHKMDEMSSNGTRSNGTDHYFDDMEDDLEGPMFDHDATFNSATFASCTRILHATVSKTSNVRLWDVMILIPAMLFLGFLLIRLKHTLVKMRAADSPLYKTFYIIIFIGAICNVLRCVISMTLTSTHETADKLMWTLLRFVFLTIELSVLTLGAFSGQMESIKNIRRVIIISTIISLSFSIAQAVLEITTPDPIFHIKTKTLHQNLFGHGGVSFWLTTSAILSVLYFCVLISPVSPCRHKLTLPNKTCFYQYVGFMLVLYGLKTVSNGLALAGISNGLCFANMANYVYFAGYIPIIYFSYLSGFFKVAQPSLLFSYRSQVIIDN